MRIIECISVLFFKSNFMNKGKKMLISTVAVVVVAGVIFILAVEPGSKVNSGVQVKDSNPVSVPTSGTNPVPIDIPGSTNTTSKTSRYKNGTYSLTTSYESPAGAENMGVSITLKNDIVVDSSFTPMANDGRSSRYQQGFASGYKSYVVGKNIDSINLDAVSGASLTSAGFNDALLQIKAKALI